MDKLLEYKLIAIGEFSHGIEESWQFRFDLLKYFMKNTNKKIFIFNKMDNWQANNIMNNTIFSRELNKFVDYNKIKTMYSSVRNNRFIHYNRRDQI
jgi:erythromycin esterase-like protein